MTLYGIAVIPLLIWAYLLLARGGFWRVAARSAADPPTAPAGRVTVLIPARNEAATIGAAVCSLAGQTFSGVIHLIVIDDGSTDCTAEVAQAAARDSGMLERFTSLRSAPLPSGWTGKLWALSQGVESAARLGEMSFAYWELSMV